MFVTEEINLIKKNSVRTKYMICFSSVLDEVTELACIN